MQLIGLIFILLSLGACSVLPAGRSAEVQPTGQPSLGPVLPTATPTDVVWTRPDYPPCEPEPLPPFLLDETGYPAPTQKPSGFPASPTLRSLAEERGIAIGAATDPAYLRRPDHAELLARQFNMLAVENAMKWEVLHPEPDRYDFTAGDALVAFARANNMLVYGHVLVWDLQQPAWLTEGEHTRQEWTQILCKHIKTVVDHYRGQIYAWDVVNEAFENDGTLRDTHWLRAIGPEYIPMAFYWARQADPDALLVYNEHSAEGLNNKSQAVYSMLQSLLRLGVPIDGVGLQMHVFLDGPPARQELAENMRRLADLGLQAHITEMDARTYASQASLAEKSAGQAEDYRAAIAVCLEAPNCNVFVTWGLTDYYSWIPGYFKQPDTPLLFDDAGRPKPAYQAVFEELQGP
jgi:endo-1,4-beta-xylanase